MTSPYSRNTSSVRSIASGSSRAGLVHALTEARDVRARGRSRQRRVGAHAVDAPPRASRTELVPMSTAATRVIAASPPPAQAGRDPTPDRIVATGEEIRVVRVQALDAALRPADAAVRPRAGVTGGQRRHRARPRTARARAVSSSGSTAASDARTPPADSTRETRRHEVGVDEPVPRRHRSAVVEERRVADHDRRAGRVREPRSRTRRAGRVRTRR